MSSLSDEVRREYEPASLDACLQELLCEEQRCKAEVILDFHKFDSLTEFNASTFQAKETSLKFTCNKEMNISQTIARNGKYVITVRSQGI